nr:hypothetical protein [Tanacetum cinerariifolium]
MTRKPSISRRNRIHWHYVRDDALFSTVKVVSRHQATQQYGTILPIELTTAEIRNSKAYQEYYACAMGEAAPKPKASARKKKGDSASSTTLPTPTPTTTAESALRLSTSAKEQLKIVLKQSRRETHISQQSGFGTGEGTGSKPGVPDVPSDDSEEELLESGGESEEEKETSEDEEVSFDPIPRAPEDSEKESDDEEEQESRLSEEARIQE